MPEVQPSSKAYKACQGCRRRRTRCDRKQPCQRCQQYSVECVHDYTRRQTKPELRQEKADLEARHNNASVVLGSLAQGKQTDIILRLLKSGLPLEDVVKGMKSSEYALSKFPIDEQAHQNQASSATLPPTSPTRDSYLNDGVAVSPSLTTSADGRKQSISTAGSREPLASFAQFGAAFPNIVSQNAQDTIPSPTHKPTNSDWQDFVQHQSFDANGLDFGTSDQSSLMDQSIFSNLSNTSSHSSFADGTVPTYVQKSTIYNPPWDMGIDLMSLPCKLVLDFTSSFFAWKDLPFPAIRKSLFVSDYLAGKTDHCSPALVRAISCLGCRALGGHNPSESSYATLGNRLFHEACLLLAQKPGPAQSVPDVQALGLLALHQLGIGLYADAIQLADEGARRMAAIIGVQVSMEDGEFNPSSPSMQAEALCSAVSLARFVRLTATHVASEGHLSATVSPLVQGCFEKTDGPPEIEDSLNLDGLLATQPPKEDTSQGAVLICRLIDWLYRIATEAGLAEEAQLPNNMLGNYQSCLVWYEKALKQQGESSFIHLVYHFCLLVLFRPFFHVLPTSGITPAGICTESCETIFSLAAASNTPGICVQSLSLIPLFLNIAGQSSDSNSPLEAGPDPVSPLQ